MKVAGFDISTKNIDCVFVDLDEIEPPDWYRWELVGRDAWERIRTVGDSMPGRSWFEDQGLYAAGIEFPFGPSSGVVGMVIGAVASRLPSNILVQRWSVKSWRKELDISNVGTKAELKQRAVDLSRVHCGTWYFNEPFDTSTWSVDAHEAHCIALATRAVLRTGQAKVA